MRPSKRSANQLRDITIERHFTKYAEGSVLISLGNTKVLCNASVEQTVPQFLKGKNQGWITAEYSMLPRATLDRTAREASRGKQNGRTIEIQRLIGRTLRAAVNLNLLSDFSIMVDCDVIQADGGTRTAAITGAMIALIDAMRSLQRKRLLREDPLKHMIAAVSVGMFSNTAILDLDYAEDFVAQTDMNVAMTETGEFIEIQGTAEKNPFSQRHMSELLSLAWQGIQKLIQCQKEALDKADKP